MSALRWADVADAADVDRVLITVRRSKTNQEGEVRDVLPSASVASDTEPGDPRADPSWRGRRPCPGARTDRRGAPASPNRGGDEFGRFLEATYRTWYAALRR